MTREEVINKLYKHCVETMDDPPEWGDVRGNLFFISMMIAAQINTNGEIVTVRNFGDEPNLKDAFGVLTEEAAKNLSRNEQYTPDLLKDIQNVAKVFLKTWDWDKESPREIFATTSAEVSKELRAKRESATYTPTRAKRLTRTNTLLANNMHDLINKGERILYTGRLKSDNPLKEVVEITMIDSAGVTIEGKYDPFYDAVLNAIISLKLAGNSFIYPLMIKRFLSQDYETTNFSKKSLEEIDQVVKNLRKMYAKVDRSDEVNRGKSKSNLRFLGGYMLEYYDAEKEINGQLVQGYYIPDMPFLYYHALTKDPPQLQTFSAELFAGTIINPTTKKPFAENKTRIGLRIYLLSQISNMKSDNERARSELRTYNGKRAKDPEGYPLRKLDSFRKHYKGNKLLYKTIFERAGLSGKSRSTLIDYESYIKACLAGWTAAEYIKGYGPLYEDDHRKDVETGVKIYLE